MAVLRDLLVQGPARFLHGIWGSTFHGDVDGTSSYATNLTAAPVLAASGNNITVTAGGKTSVAFTVPFATNATSAGSAGTATKAGVSTIWMYPENNNEINFGGTNSESILYFGYRAKDSRSIPTEFRFGGSAGFATLTAGKFVKNGGTSAQFLKADGTVDSTSYAALASPAFTGTPTAPTANAGTNTTQIATTAFVKAEINSVLAASDAMIYKGTLGTGGTITSLPATHSVGDTYKVITAGTYAGAKCEIGDMIICITNGTASTDAHWTVVQTNIDGAVTGPTASVANRVAIFDGTTGKVIKDSGFTISASVPSGAKFTDTTYSVLTAASGGTSASLVTTGEKYTWNNKVDKSAGVTAVSYDTTNKKITRTINGTTTDVVTAATIVSDGGGAFNYSYTLPANKGVRISYSTNHLVIVGAYGSNGSAQMVLVGGGYGYGGTTRNKFTEVVSPATSSGFKWSLPASDSISCAVEVLSTRTSDSYVRVISTGVITFTAIDALTTAEQNNPLLSSTNYTTYTVKKDGTGASGSWGINITGTASNATKLNGQSASYYASASHNHDSDYLKLVSGSTPVSFNTNNLPSFSGAPSYLVGIEAFASGGTLKWQNASSCTVGSATRATNLAGGAANKIPYQTAAGTTSFIAAGTSGQVLKAGTNGVPAWGTDNDTKNTAGTTNSASVKLFVVGAKEQSANPQTFTNVNTYINTDNNLYSNGFVAATSVRAKGKDMYLGTASADQFHMQYDSTTRCVKFIFD